jgi:hypothetical protein
MNSKLNLSLLSRKKRIEKEDDQLRGKLIISLFSFVLTVKHLSEDDLIYIITYLLSIFFFSLALLFYSYN